MKKRKNIVDSLVALVEELEEIMDDINMTRKERDALDYTFTEIKDILENGN